MEPAGRLPQEAAMTRPAQSAASDLGGCFEVFMVSAFGLETLRAYAAPGEQDRVRAFRRGLPLPERPAGVLAAEHKGLSAD